MFYSHFRYQFGYIGNLFIKCILMYLFIYFSCGINILFMQLLLHHEFILGSLYACPQRKEYLWQRDLSPVPIVSK